MSRALLDRARAILAHAKQGLPLKPNTIEAEEQSPMTDLTVPVFAPGGETPSQAAPTIQNFEIQPAAPNAKAIYWETGTGQILGPAELEFLGRDGNSYWISMTFQGQVWWVNADRLRSKKAFEAQVQCTKAERRKEFR